MSIVDLAAAATHLRVELDEVGDEVASLLERAEQIAAIHIGRPLSQVMEESVLPANVEAAILLIVSTLYDVRVAQPFGVNGIDLSNPLSSAVQSLLLPYRSAGVF